MLVNVQGLGRRSEKKDDTLEIANRCGTLRWLKFHE